MLIINPLQIICLLIAFMAYWPLRVLLQNYLKTQIVDFFLFGGVFILQTMVLLTDLILISINNHFLQVIKFLAHDTAFFVLLIHSYRFRYKIIPASLWMFGVLWFIGLVIGGFLANYDFYYQFLSALFSFYALGILFVSYLKINILYLSVRAKRSKYLWLIAWFFLFTYIFSLLVLPDYLSTMTTVLLLIWILIVLYITIFIPEGLLLSESQVIRILPFYDSIHSDNSHNDDIIVGGKGEIDLISLNNYIVQLSRQLDKEKK